ncbi:MAG: hypothetical protein K0S24_2977 [Sphingobacterium sp.]|jgi:hypothetical protein|nr:hypothetical protein [Sphingobacterium sp.]
MFIFVLQLFEAQSNRSKRALEMKLALTVLLGLILIVCDGNINKLPHILKYGRHKYTKIFIRSIISII